MNMKCVTNQPITAEQIEQILSGIMTPGVFIHLHECEACRDKLTQAQIGATAIQELLHPPTRELVDFIEGDLEPERYAEIEEHVMQCARCRVLVEDLQAIDEEIQLDPDLFVRELPGTVIKLPREQTEVISIEPMIAERYEPPLRRVMALGAADRIPSSTFQMYRLDDIQIQIRVAMEERLLEGYLFADDTTWETADVIVLTDDDQQVTINLDEDNHFEIRGLTANPIRIVFESVQEDSAIEVDLR